MSANLITGNLFSPILASQDSDYQAGVSGDKTLILPVGAKMSLEIEDANTVRANDGVLVTKEGRRVQIDTGAVEEWSIPTGTQGETSYYLIGFHLYTTEESAEICETFIEKVSSATDTITENTFKGGATEVYITLGRVTQDGINLDSVEGLIDTADSLTDLGAKITQINADLSDTVTASQIGSGTKTFEIASIRKRLTIITKKSNVVVGTKEIPTNVLESGDVIVLGDTASIIGTDNIRTGGSLDTTLIGKELYIHGVQDSIGTNHDQLRGVTSGTINNGKDIGLAADLSQTSTATLTFNGSNSFTLAVTDSTLSVYVY